jgi:hypothetical protein
MYRDNDGRGRKRYTIQSQSNTLYDNLTGTHDHGIPIRDRFTDIFAYFPSDEVTAIGPHQHDHYDERDNFVLTELGSDTLNDAKMAVNILRGLNKSNLDPVELQFIYCEILDSMALIMIKDYKKAISQPWLTMKTHHIDPLEKSRNCKLITIINKKLTDGELRVKKRVERRLNRIGNEDNKSISKLSIHSLTDYRFYVKRILDHHIDIPDRFDISSAEPYSMNSSYLPIRLMAKYYKRIKNKSGLVSSSINLLDSQIHRSIIDLTPVYLFDIHSVRSKTMVAVHISKPSKKDGITVSDQMSYLLYVALSNEKLSRYLAYYGTSNFSVYYINDPLQAMICHISYALLEPDMRRAVFYSPKQIVDMIEILAEYTDQIKKNMLSITGHTETDISTYIIDTKDTKDIKEEDSGDQIFERIIYVTEVLQCIKETANGISGISGRIVSECIKDLWPKLSMICCEITAKDSLYLKVASDLLRTNLTGITIYSPIYVIPETVVGYNLECTSSNQYIIDPSKAYFEFLEVDDTYFNSEKEELHAKSFRHLKTGSYYELVVSSYHTDAVRMMTGEIIKICGYRGPTPIVTPICREFELIYCREHNDSKDRIVAPEQIEAVLMESNLNVIDYCFRRVDATYKFYLELNRSEYIDNKGCDKDNKGCDKDNKGCDKDNKGCDKDNKGCDKDNKGCDKDNKGCDKKSIFKAKNICTGTIRVKDTAVNNIIGVKDSVKKSRILYRLSRLLIPDYGSQTNSNNNVEVRIVEPNTFSKLIAMRVVDSVDPATIRIHRRVVDSCEIDVLKGAITHQFV